jgi:hypothetical protein
MNLLLMIMLLAEWRAVVCLSTPAQSPLLHVFDSIVAVMEGGDKYDR